MTTAPWQFVERVSVRKIGQGFVAEARWHGHFEMGEIASCPVDAMDSAIRALDAVLRPMMTPALFGDLL